MGLLQRLEVRQGQSLVMTPQLLQAIKLLQLSHLDLAAFVEAELERNPLLERPEPEPAEDLPAAVPDGAGDRGADQPDWQAEGLAPDPSGHEGGLDNGLDNVFPDDVPARPGAHEGDLLPLGPSPWSAGGGRDIDDDGPDLEATLSQEADLRGHLLAQLDLATCDPIERLVGSHLIDAIDEAGYLRESVEEVAARLGAPTATVGRVLGLIQGFEPSGIGARDLSECLALQLEERDRFDPAMRALVSRLDLVAKRDLVALRRLCGVDDEDLREMLAEIRRLEPKPGRAFGAGPVQVLVPDVVVRAAPGGEWHVELNPETLPRVLVNQTYYARVSKATAGEREKAFLSDCWQTAHWLARSLDQRARTVLKVATEIVRQQDGFFRHGVAHLKPLNLKTVADAIGMHESTISRVTSNKAIGTSRGTFEMKYFFTAAIAGAAGAEAHSSEAVRHRIRQLIDAEEARDVLSDDALVRRLKGEGVDIARRTVAKYRESLRIPSSVERRRLKLAARRA
ncbi:MAG TPA: RNA polymerase factor sigma-54 [Microvirga sp.]|jgi:RNA polymerase sigma-54 factor|nr:RNA polymerase factor sigma-54 [Microvirga sp.]